MAGGDNKGANYERAWTKPLPESDEDHQQASVCVELAQRADGNETATGTGVA